MPDLKYGHGQFRGRVLQQWIEGEKVESEVCPIQPCKLVFADLLQWKPIFNENAVPLPVKDKARELGVWPEDLNNENSSWRKFRIAPVDPMKVLNFKDRWGGMTGPGVIFTDEMFRKDGHHPSEIMKAVYWKDFAQTSLKHVFVLDIKNPNTKSIVRKIYKEGNSLGYPDPRLQGRVWEWGTPEYQALLGTEIGKVVAYFVLGAFGKGKRRIVRVVSWALPGNPSLEFDIEKIDPAAAPSGKSSATTSLQTGGKDKRRLSDDAKDETTPDLRAKRRKLD
ncbi:uncharacterized protein N7496_011551 [Penicillium cataractarum]|uniref:Uncharacterized protein n=1 Tax=Penicillium cataractarum TaxID=2100454 RepID=A0A9W9UVK9_9EURO|nr:uncharacterized protein N7496_011551 [Penicillium cataractarum]KAJ5359138.1 hypothetical protein N7496_011551 [Penicillium cataractarum]